MPVDMQDLLELVEKPFTAKIESEERFEDEISRFFDSNEERIILNGTRAAYEMVPRKEKTTQK